MDATFLDANRIGSLEEVVQSLRDSVNGLHVTVQEMLKRLDNNEQETHQKLLDERQSRENAIREMQRELAASSERTDRRFDNIDTNLKSVSGGIERLAGALDNIGKVIESREKAFDESGKRIDKVEAKLDNHASDLNLLTITQEHTLNDLKKISVALHGDPSLPNASPSLYKVVGTLAEYTRTGFEDVKNGQAAVLELAKQSAVRIDSIEAKQIAQAQKWEARKASVMEFSKAIAGSRVFWAVAGAAMIGVIVGVFPSAAETVREILILLLGQK